MRSAECLCLWSCQGKDDCGGLVTYLFSFGPQGIHTEPMQSSPWSRSSVWGTTSSEAVTAHSQLLPTHQIPQLIGAMPFTEPWLRGKWASAKGRQELLRKPFDGKITKPGWYSSLGMALGLSPKGLWSMDYDSPGFVQLSSSCIGRPNLSWILPPSSWVRSNQFLGDGLWSSPPPKIVLCTRLGGVEDRGNTQEVGLALCKQIKATQFVSMSQLAAKFVNSLPCLICPHLELTCHTLSVL